MCRFYCLHLLVLTGIKMPQHFSLPQCEMYGLKLDPPRGTSGFSENSRIIERHCKETFLFSSQGFLHLRIRQASVLRSGLLVDELPT